MNEKELARAQECAEVLIEREYDMYDLEYMDLEIKKMFPALVAEVRRLRAALEPFAKMADDVSELEKQALEAGYSKYFLIVGKDGKALEFADFRRACDALKGGAQ